MFDQRVGKQKYVYTFSENVMIVNFRISFRAAEILWYFAMKNKETRLRVWNGFRVGNYNVAETNFVFYHNRVDVNKCFLFPSVASRNIWKSHR